MYFGLFKFNFCVLAVLIVYKFIGYRVEDFLYEKIEKKRPNRLSNLEYFGQDMNEAGNEFGPGTPYGKKMYCCHFFVFEK
jgi:hypothetical protein